MIYIELQQCHTLAIQTRYHNTTVMVTTSRITHCEDRRYQKKEATDYSKICYNNYPWASMGEGKGGQTFPLPLLFRKGRMVYALCPPPQHTHLYMMNRGQPPLSFCLYLFATPPIGFVHVCQSRTPSANRGLVV